MAESEAESLRKKPTSFSLYPATKYVLDVVASAMKKNNSEFVEVVLAEYLRVHRGELAERGIDVDHFLELLSDPTKFYLVPASS